MKKNIIVILALVASALLIATGSSCSKSGKTASNTNTGTPTANDTSKKGITVAGGDSAVDASGELSNPRWLFLDVNGNMYVSDMDNNRVQKFVRGSLKGTTVAGLTGFQPDQKLDVPEGVWCDLKGNVYVASGMRVLKWVPGATTGIPLGLGSGPCRILYPSPIYWAPKGVFVDALGNLFISQDCYSTGVHISMVQKWEPGDTCGTVIAGGNSHFYNGEGNAANQLENPCGVFVDNTGNVFIADASNSRIQKWPPGATEGITVAGGNGSGSAKDQLDGPAGIYVDKAANMYICDAGNQRIVKWPVGSSEGVVVAGGNGAGSAANQFFKPCGVFVDERNGDIYVCDAGNHRIQKWSR